MIKPWVRCVVPCAFFVFGVTGCTDASEGEPPADPDAPGPYGVATDELRLEDTVRGGSLSAFMAYPSTSTGEPDFSGAPYPLVVFSHGVFAYPTMYRYLFERMASHGFVVLGAKHPDSAEFAVENLLEACRSIPRTEQLTRMAEMVAGLLETNAALRRPSDLSQLIDHAEDLAATDPMFSGLIETDRVAAVGHSFGGLTSMLAGGAELDTASIQAACTGGPDDWLATFLTGERVRGLMCFLLNGLEGDALDEVDELDDARIVAVASLAGPLELIWGPRAEGLAALRTPFMLVYTDTDEATPYDFVREVYPELAGPKYLATLFGGNHANFGTVDAAQIEAIVSPLPEECLYSSFGTQMFAEGEAPLLPGSAQNRLTAAAVTAFVERHLRSHARAATYLTPEYFGALDGDRSELLANPEP